MKNVFDFVKKRIIKASRGVISIFLALLLVPFTSIACGLLTTARINSAVAIFDEALCNASNSTLGTYDSFLKSRFGLLATRQDYTSDDFINDLFKKYLEVNLGALSNTYLEYECQANGVFSLGDTNILKSQILEFSKYTVPTQVAIDGLDIDGLISSLEKSLGFGNIFSIASKTIDTGSAIVQLGIDYDTLKSTVESYESANSGYNSAYSEFSSAVNTFVDEVSAKKATMEQKKGVLDSAEKKLDNPEIRTLTEEIEELKLKIEEEKEKEKPDEALISKWEETLSEKEDKLKTLNDAASKANKAYQKALKEYNNAKNDYDKAVSTNKSKVTTEKGEYVTAIDNVIWWLKEYKSDLKAVQDDLINVSTNAANTAVAITKEVNSQSNKEHSSQKEKNEAQIKENNKKISETDDEDLKEELRKENDYLKLKNDLINKEDVSIKNTNTVTDKANSAVQKSVKDVSEKITETSQSFFDEKIEALEELKESVSNFDVENIQSKIYSPSYHYKLDGLFPTLAEVIDSEGKFVGNIVKDSAWTMLKTILSFIDALLNLTLFYVPELNAVVDLEYYKGLKEDVPENGFDIKEDEKLSQQYKELFGDYSANDMDALAAYDVIASIKNIFTQFGIISSKFSGGNIITSILTLGETISDIKEAFTTIKNEITSLFSFIANLITGSGIYQKFLVAGYATYMTSNRTTYTKESPLNSASYNMKGTEGLGSGPVSEALKKITKPTSLQSAVNASNVGDSKDTKDKCFKGAETEYLIVGDKSEKKNQTTTFWIIYATRVVLNMPAVFTNVEVASMAAAATVLSPVVYVVVLLLEALADTMLLVNGLDVPVLKLHTVYITPTGMGKFIEKLSPLALSTETLSGIKSTMNSTYQSKEMSDATAAFTTESSTSHLDEGNKTKSEPDFIDFDYTKYMFVATLLFTSEEKLLKRLSDIIQMECTEKQINDGKADTKFNINRSYTYIRTSASFTTNEFIRLSTSDGLFGTQERILYKGY